MTNLARSNAAEPIAFENDLKEPLVGAVIKEPTALGFTYLVGMLGLCFVPGYGWLSGLALAAMGWFDVNATIKTDDQEPEPKVLPASSNTQADQPTSTYILPKDRQEQVSFTEPSPWMAPGPQRKLPPVDLSKPFNDPKEEADYQQFAKAGRADDKKPECLASIMATPDDDGYYRSRLLTGKTRTGKGLVTQMAVAKLKVSLGPKVELFCIDAKNDPQESYRWAVVPKQNRFRFAGTAPDVDPKSAKAGVDAIFKAFYESTAEYKFLLVSELKILKSVISRHSKAAQFELSSFLSAQAVGGASSHRYIWIDTNVVGIAENGFSGSGDRDAFELDYVVTKKNQRQITGHVSFVGNPVIPAQAFGESGRAFSSSSVEGWHPISSKYAELDDELKSAQPPQIAKPVATATDKDAHDISTVCLSALREQSAISLTIKQLSSAHSGIERMAHEKRDLLVASLNKADELGLIRVVEVGGVISVCKCKNHGEGKAS